VLSEVIFCGKSGGPTLGFQRMEPVNTRLRSMHVLLAAAVLVAPVAAQVVTEKVDYEAIYKIKDEGFQRSQVMDVASWLTDVYGPRLTGSPNIKAAGEWTVKKLAEWGAANPRMEPWGTFGRGWVNERFSATALSGAQPWTIIGVPKAWTPGLDAPTTAEALYAPMENEADFEKWKGKLKGKIVLAVPIREVKPHFDPEATRLSDADSTSRTATAGTTTRPRSRSPASGWSFSPVKASWRYSSRAAAAMAARYSSSRGRPTTRKASRADLSRTRPQRRRKWWLRWNTTTGWHARSTRRCLSRWS
jgi:hypothetical protein